MPKILLALTLAALLSISAAAQQEAAAEAAPADLVERILELQRQIDELTARLTPEARQELRRRLALLAEGVADVAEGRADAADVARGAAESAPDPVAPETASTEVAPSPPPSPTPAAATPALPELRRRSRRQPCNTLVPLDENGDGSLSSADRYWRYVYVWTDHNGDGQMQEREIESVYEHGIHEIATSLENFSRRKGGLGEIRIRDHLVLDLRGDGFGERASGDDGVLLLDATAVARGDGPRLLGPGGETLGGFQPFRAGLAIRLGDQVTALDCPRASGDGD